MPPFLENMMDKFKLFIGTEKGGYVPFDSITTCPELAPIYDRPDYEPPIDYTTSWTATMSGVRISNKGMAMLLTGFSVSKTRKVLRHMEWWRRYALKTGTEPRDTYQCYLEVTGRAWRPKMPKRK